jgi:hypothetical protein
MKYLFNSLRVELPSAWSWDGLTAMYLIPSFWILPGSERIWWLKPLWCKCSFGWKNRFLFYSSHAPLTHFIRIKWSKQKKRRNNIFQVKGITIPKGTSSSSLNSFFIILVAMTTWCNSVLPWQSDTTFKKQ